jgi:Flp pilus assembly protein TadG
MTPLREWLPRRDQRGVVAIYVAVLTPVLFGLAAFAVDVSRWYVELQRLQRAADAGALAAAPFMPENLTSSNPATSAALDEVRRNGFPASAAEVLPGNRPSQVRVTVTTTVSNSFARIFSTPTMTLHRSAVAEYLAPAPMGSACNTFGNEPGASMLATPPVRGCTQSPNFWATIHGPGTKKVDGDQNMTRNCGPAGVYGCSGTTNGEFDPDGYFFVVRVGGAAVGRNVQVQLYDPAFVPTGAQCQDQPGGPPPPDHGVNPCSGDYDPEPPPSPGPVDTTFALRSPIETLDPVAAPVVSGCVKQYRGYADVPSADPTVFQQWVTLCTITNAQAGDYYLQVRTNRRPPGTAAVVDGGPDATSSGDDASVVGRGNNAFALRAFVPADSSASRGITVSAWQRMPIVMNAPVSAPPAFQLIRATPEAAGATITFIIFDVGDNARSGGTVQVLPPDEAARDPRYAVGFGAGGTVIDGCVASEVNEGPLSRCTVAISQAQNNGKAQVISVPVPTGYDCDVDDPGGCLFRLKVDFFGQPVTDVTTWTAFLPDAVRLVE